MKRLILLAVILTFAATVNAQTADKKWGFGAGLGAYGTVDNSGIGLMPELYLSRYLNPRFDIMLKNNIGLFRSDLINDLDLANPLLNLRLKLSNETRNFRPYLFAGPGFLADNNESGLNFNLGLGAKYYFNPKTAFYFDAGYISGLETTRGLEKVTDNFWKATLGMEFDFGKTKDSDMDGVSDKKDKCPDTPAGVAVDANGCPLDTDGDGVPDHLDDCPTVAGLTSLKGCPDTDGDGVPDKDDKCPDTPKGWKVDASGCPIDTDKDGLFDEEDDCPTVAGPKENKGCPVKEVEKKEITIDQIEIQNIQATPIHFLSDKSYVTDYSKGILDKLIKTLNENKDYNVNIFGHTDSQGSDGYNINLAKERIESTIKYLESKGISANRIIHQKAFGKAKPIASNKTPEGRLQNRRVEFEIFKMK